MICKVEFGLGFDGVESRTWLDSVGLGRLTESGRAFEIEFIRIPDILGTFLRLEGSLQVAKINRDGITFYLTNHTFTSPTAAGGDREPMIEPDAADGCLFVPMANVVCVNGFGTIRRVDARKKRDNNKYKNE